MTELDVAEITAKKPDTDDEKSLVQRRFCATSGELLGVSRVLREISNECLKGSKRRETVAAIEASIKQVEESINKACQ